MIVHDVISMPDGRAPPFPDAMPQTAAERKQTMESMESSINILSEELENSATGEKVPGFTVVVDGEFRQVLDGIIAYSNGKYKVYFQIVADALTTGVNAVIDSLEQGQK